MASTIEFYFDFGSPYAYLAHTQLPALARTHGKSIAYHPVDLGLLKRAAGNTSPATREMPVKHRHLRIDLQRWATLYGVVFQPPKGYGSERINRGSFYAEDRDTAAEYAQIVWQCVWAEGTAMADDEILIGIARRLGWNADGFLSFVDTEEARNRYAAENSHAIELGIFGVPTMVLGNQMWWGNDRLQFLKAHLEEAGT